ncbi:hypothetical protein AVEN_131813-1, partial [Araneus ventricosus]
MNSAECLPCWTLGKNKYMLLFTVGLIKHVNGRGNDKFAALKVTLLLGVNYAANVGGTGTIIGTTPNLVLMTVLQKLYPGSDEITFATWMMYNVPGVLLCIFFGWLYLWLVNIYFS